MIALRLIQKEKFYKEKRWERKRNKILKRDGYQCQMSKRFGKIRSAEVVHHILPLEEYPEYALCDWNLISLSREAHNTLHDRVTGELTERGKALARKIMRENKIPPCFD